MAAVDLWTSTDGGALLAAAVLLPFVGMLLGLLLGGRWLQRVAFVLMPLGLALAVAIAMAWFEAPGPLVYLLGGWSPPLGIALRADGLSVAMMLAVAGVVCGIGAFARADFGLKPGETESRGVFAYWLLLLAVWGALNLVFVSGDLFTLYVALELLTFAGVPLVCLAGSGETLRAALRYMLFALCGSVLYLLGAVLLYGGYGTLDMPLLSRALQPEPIAMAALALMTAGLLAKTALVPLHLWLPPAHAGAPAAASAVLSALVVKGSFFLLLRLWAGALPGLLLPALAQGLATLGALAILVGGVMALRAARLKLLVAWSTVAQIGYLFLMLPLVLAGGEALGAAAWLGGVLQAVSHAIAKAAMFLAAGSIALALGHDRVAELGAAARVAPMSLLAFALAGFSLMGLPPSGGFAAKWLLLSSAVGTGQWWWALVVLGGGLLTGGYLYRVLAAGLTGEPAGGQAGDAAAARRLQGKRRAGALQGVPLGLALISLLIGLLPLQALGLVQIGRGLP
jgi:formate hydrogenlyase subunit 3/multisubunit Na+/H+ antiporter MnhD subunit